MNLKFQKAERAYYPNVEPKFDNNDLEDFLINNFKIPGNNLNQISSLINEDGELKKIILDLPDIIKKEFPNDEMQIRFYDEFQEYELILEINHFQKLNRLRKMRNEADYDNTTSKPLEEMLINAKLRSKFILELLKEFN